MTMIKLLLCVCICAFMLVLLKQIKPEFSVLLKFSVLLCILSVTAFGLLKALEDVSAMLSETQIAAPYFQTVLKILGLCITAQIVENICKDCGETALATVVEITAKISVLAVCIPFAKSLLEIGTGWLQ